MNWIFRPSQKKNKKYDVLFKDRWIAFGDSRYQHYRDRTGLGLYSHLDHNDKKRRERYKKRHEKILLKNGKPAVMDMNSPAYWSYFYLW